MITVNGTIPVLTNIQYANDAAIELMELPENGCSHITSRTVVQNTGSEDITSITFQISINGGTPQSYNWTGDALKPFTAMDVYVPAMFFENGEDENEYVISVTAVNGTTDENPANNTMSGTFENAGEYALPVGLHLVTDDNAWGTTWELRDSQNNIIQQGDSYENNSTYNIPIVADAGCYTFIMKDSDRFFFGSYSLTDGDNNVIISVNGAFGNEKTTAFTLPFYAPTAGISSSTSILCEGGVVQFFDASTGGATSWNWTFEGGDPPTSTDKNPEVAYYSQGNYDVTLEVSNDFGTDEITIEDYISVYSLSYGNRTLEFNGIDNYVEAADESVFDIQDEITLECWFKPASLNGTQGLMSKNYGNNAHPYQVRLNGNEIVFGFYSNSIGWQPIQTSGANLTTGQWYHVAAVYNMSTMKIYVDGVQKATANKNFQIPQNNHPFEVARTNDINYKYFDGKIDEVRVWNRALSASEVAENMCTNLTGTTDTTLIAYYKFNECGGTLLTDVIGGHDGLLKNMIGFEWYDSDACDSYSITFNITEEDGGAAIEGAAVNLNGSTKFTDAQGQIVFEGYEPGLYDYIVSKNAYWDVSGNFELTDEDVTIDITMIDQPVYNVTFIVSEDPSGTPIEDAVVDLDGNINLTNSNGEVTFESIEAGTYTWTVSKEGFVTQAGTCEVVDEDITVEVSVLIVSVEDQLRNEVKVYPNPSNGKLYVSISDSDAENINVSVTDLTGRQIYKNTFEGSGTKLINMTGIKPGIYILNLTYNNKNIKRIISVK
jgi:PKD repeat protein